MGADVHFNYIDTLGHDNGTALHCAVEQDELVIMELLLSAGASVHARHNGFTPLHYVRSIEGARLLIAHGANVNATCESDSRVLHCRGDSVLHSVLYFKSPPYNLVLFLIQRGADPQAPNNLGNTPLDYAKKYMHKSKEQGLILTAMLSEKRPEASQSFWPEHPIPDKKYLNNEPLRFVLGNELLGVAGLSSAATAISLLSVAAYLQHAKTKTSTSSPFPRKEGSPLYSIYPNKIENSLKVPTQKRTFHSFPKPSTSLNRGFFRALPINITTLLHTTEKLMKLIPK